MQQMFMVFQNSDLTNFVLNIALIFQLGILQRRSILFFNIYNFQWLMVHNLKQLRERHCISFIQLIKQDVLKNFFLLVSYKKQSEF